MKSLNSLFIFFVFSFAFALHHLAFHILNFMVSIFHLEFGFSRSM